MTVSGALSLLGCTLLAGCAHPGPSSGASPTEVAAPTAAQPVERPGIAVVELFTSEGCSSCPPADAVLARLADEARADPSLALFPLSFHVDYWNDLGWSDRFSAPAFTDRQRAYARTFHSTSLYTPQAVIDGLFELVGSDEEGIRGRIAAVSARSAQTTVTLAMQSVDDATLRIVAELSPVPTDAMLDVVLAERDARSTVTKGENAGRSLLHVNVVRALEHVVPQARTTVMMRLPGGVRREDVVVVALVQRTLDLRIVGAAAIDGR